jgi:hypothetical protein
MVWDRNPDIAVLGTKGQYYSHAKKELAIIPNTKIIVYRKDDKLA